MYVIGSYNSMDVGEIRTITFDFSPLLANNETISNPQFSISNLSILSLYGNTVVSNTIIFQHVNALARGSSDCGVFANTSLNNVLHLHTRITVS